MHIFLKQTVGTQVFFPEYFCFNKLLYCHKCCCSDFDMVKFRDDWSGKRHWILYGG